MELIKTIDECNKTTTTTTNITNIQSQYARYKMMAAIRSGINETMGKDTCDLLLQTMNLVYRIDEEKIIRQPKLFVDSLVKLLGKDAAPVILTAILNEMKN